MSERYGEYFKDYVKRGVELELLSPELARFDLQRLGEALKPERDLQFNYLGLQTLYDRYFIHSGDIRFELPQAFFMRVAMGLAIQEVDREERAIEFYDLLSSFDFMSSTPTLFNAGTLRPQLSSCYLTTVPDDLDGIYSAIKDNALLSKFAGGLGNDWTRVRGMGPTSRGPMANPRAWCPSSRSPTTRRSRSIRVESARARSAPISKPGTSTSRSSSTCARTPATTAVVPTT